VCCGKKTFKRRPPRVKHLKPKTESLEALAVRPPAMKTFLMCRPNSFGITYTINPWMSLSNPVDRGLATEQWGYLYDRIVECGADVRMVKGQPKLPDMVFTANAALVFKEKKIAVVSNFKHAERKGEEEWFVGWFAEEDWVVKYPSAAFEGAGDVLSLHGTLVCGTGFRSSEEAHREIAELGEIKQLIVRLVDSRFYHLDTCFCPLDQGEYLIFPSAFDPENLEAIRKIGGQEIAVPEEEAVRFACNSISIGRNVILPSECPKTMELLNRFGYNPIPVAMSEFIKSGGACKCLTLEIA
jgi:N-dimethylarginine dimethylaminohydrolase